MQRRRRSSRRRSDVASPRTKKSRISTRSKIQKDRLALGTAKALRDRIIQHQDPDGNLPHKLKQLCNEVQRKIDTLLQRIPTNKQQPTAAEVSVINTPSCMCNIINTHFSCTMYLYVQYMSEIVLGNHLDV